MGSQDEADNITKELTSSQGEKSSEPLVQDQSTKLHEVSGGTESSVASPTQAEVLEELSKPLLAELEVGEEAIRGNELGVESTDDGRLVVDEVKEGEVDDPGYRPCQGSWVMSQPTKPIQGSDQAATSLDQEHVQPNNGSVVESVESSDKGAPVEEKGHNEGADEVQSTEADEPAKEATEAQEEAPSAVEPEQPSGEAPSQGTKVEEQAEKKVTEAQKEKPSSGGKPEQAEAGEGAEAAGSFNQSGAHEEPKQAEADGGQGTEAVEQQEHDDGEAGVSHDQAAEQGDKGTEAQEEPPVAADVPSVPVAEELISTDRDLEVEEIEHKKVPEEATAAEEPVPEAQEPVHKEDATSTLEPQEGAPPSVEPRQAEADRGQGIAVSHDQELLKSQDGASSMEPAETEADNREADTSHTQAAEEGDKGTTQEEPPVAVEVPSVVESTDRHLEVGPDAAEEIEHKEVPEAREAAEAQVEAPAAQEPEPKETEAPPVTVEVESTDRHLEVGPEETKHKEVPEAREEATEAQEEAPAALDPEPKGAKAQDEPPSVAESTDRHFEVGPDAAEETEHKEVPEVREESAEAQEGAPAALEPPVTVEVPSVAESTDRHLELGVGPDAAEETEDKEVPEAREESAEAQEEAPAALEPPVTVEVPSVAESTDRHLELEVGPDAAEETEHKEVPEAREESAEAQEQAPAALEPEPKEGSISAVEPQSSAVEPKVLEGTNTDQSAEQKKADVNDQAAKQGEGQEEAPVAAGVPPVAEGKTRELEGPGTVEETEHKIASEAPEEASAAAGPVFEAQEEATPETQEEASAAAEPAPKEETTSALEPQEEASSAVAATEPAQPEAEKHEDGDSHDQAAEQGHKVVEAQEEPKVLESTHRELEVAPRPVEHKEVPEAQEETTAPVETEPSQETASAVEPQEEAFSAVEPGQPGQGTNIAEQEEVASSKEPAQPEAEKHEDGEASISHDQAAEPGDKEIEAQEQPPVAAHPVPVPTDRDLEVAPGSVKETKHKEVPEAQEETTAPGEAEPKQETASVVEPQEEAFPAVEPGQPEAGGQVTNIAEQEEGASSAQPEKHEDGEASISHDQAAEPGDKEIEAQEAPPVAALPVPTDRDLEVAPGPVKETEHKEVPEAQEETTAPGETEPKQETASVVEPQEEASAVVEPGQPEAGGQVTNIAEQEEGASSTEPAQPEKHEGSEASISHDQAAEPGDKEIKAQEEPPFAALPVPVPTDRELEVAPGPVEETEHKEVPEAQEESLAPVEAEPKQETASAVEPQEDVLQKPQKEASSAVEPGQTEGATHAAEVADVPVEAEKAVAGADTAGEVEHQGQVPDNEQAAPGTGEESYRGPEPVPEAKVIESPPEAQASSDAKEEASQADTKPGAEGKEDLFNQPAASETAEVVFPDVESPLAKAEAGPEAGLQGIEASPLSTEGDVPLSSTATVEVDEKAEEKEETERSSEVSPAEAKVDDEPAGSVEATEVSSTPEVADIVPGPNEQVTKAESSEREVSPEAKTEAGNQKVDEDSAQDVKAPGQEASGGSLEGAAVLHGGEAPLVDSTGQTKEAKATQTSADKGVGQNAAAAGGGTAEQKVAEKRSEAQVPHIAREVDPGTPASLTAGVQPEAGAKLEEPEATFEDAEDLDAPRHTDAAPEAQNEGINVEKEEDSTGDEDEKHSGGIVGGIVGAALKAIGFGKSTTKPSKKKRMQLKKQMETMKLASN